MTDFFKLNLLITYKAIRFENPKPMNSKMPPINIKDVSPILVYKTYIIVVKAE